MIKIMGLSIHPEDNDRSSAVNIEPRGKMRLQADVYRLARPTNLTAQTHHVKRRVGLPYLLQVELLYPLKFGELLNHPRTNTKFDLCPEINGDGRGVKS